MSQITFADKQEWDNNTPVDATMKLTPNDVNMIKAATNSKQDSKLVQNLASPNSVDYPSTAAIVAALANVSMYKGVINGTGDLNSSTYKDNGFWMPATSFTLPAHGSYPINAKGALIVYKGNNQVLQRYITFAATSGGAVTEYIRSYDNDFSVWGAWSILSGSGSGGGGGTLVTNLNSPDNITYPSTLAVTNYLNSGQFLKYLGNIDGTDDLDTFVNESGFYTPNNYATIHASFPTGINLCFLEVFKGTIVFQRLTEVVSGDIYMRFLDGIWSAWYLVKNAAFSWGIPAITLNNGASEYAVSLISGNNIGGLIRLTKTANGPTTSVEIKLVPSINYSPNAISANINARTHQAFQSQYAVVNVKNDEIRFRTGVPVNIGDYFEYYFSVTLNR